MSSAFWFLDEAVDSAYVFGELLVADEQLGVTNTADVHQAEYELQNAMHVLLSDDVPLPTGFPMPRLALPDMGFSPDYFCFGVLHFASRRLREALSQPDDVVQFAPVELVRGGVQARAQDYRLMRVLARQPAMDLGRSDCELEDWVNRITGEASKRPGYIRRFALFDDLSAATDIFRIAESPSYILATDDLAGRVLRAGCTGVEFNATDNLRTGTRVERYRTVDGVAERRVDFLD